MAYIISLINKVKNRETFVFTMPIHNGHSLQQQQPMVYWYHKKTRHSAAHKSRHETVACCCCTQHIIKEALSHRRSNTWKYNNVGCRHNTKAATNSANLRAPCAVMRVISDFWRRCSVRFLRRFVAGGVDGNFVPGGRPGELPNSTQWGCCCCNDAECYLYIATVICVREDV